MSSSDEEKTQVGDVDAPELESKEEEHVWVYETLSFPREALFVTVICMGHFCTQAGQLPTLVLLRTIGKEFGVTTSSDLAWLMAGYALTVGTFILFSGRLGDVFGYKRMLIIGFAWFSVWSLVAGLSVYSNFTLMVFARVLQGIGPAICLPNGLALAGAAYPPGHRKAMVFALFGSVAPSGAVISAIMASVLDMAWWPWAYWVFAIFLAFLAVLGAFVVPHIPVKEAPPKDLKSLVTVLDLPGAVVGVTSLVLFNFAWVQAPGSGWNTPTVIAPLVLGIVLFAAFAVIESRFSPMPLLPLKAITVDIGLVLGAMAFGWATFGIWILYLSQLIEDIRGHGPLLTSLWFCPTIIAGGLAGILTGKLLGPFQVKPPVLMTISLLAFFTGSTLVAFAPTDQVYWGQIFVAMVIMPFGMDMSFPAATLILSDNVPPEHQGIGASLVNTVINYGIALGVGIAGTVEIHVNRGGLTKEDRLDGYRGALYMSMGMAILGLLICLVFLARGFSTHKR
ncbi:Low affinity ammonium transporter [Cladobotryum mycophilum]|uniref:Low affinity ammonium transporter n=1 Tax=Cladobotryum mycophilum TaxID=491253 RepID=A0ABR0SQF9_9HYPO